MRNENKNFGVDSETIEELCQREQIWNAKIKLPDLADHLIIRTALIEEVESEEKKITVFHGGAGYGKTTLMAQIASRHREYCLWYQADILDNNPNYFFEGLLYGFCKGSDKLAKTVKSVKNVYTGGSTTDFDIEKGLVYDRRNSFLCDGGRFSEDSGRVGFEPCLFFN